MFPRCGPGHPSLELSLRAAELFEVNTLKLLHLFGVWNGKPHGHGIANITGGRLAPARQNFVKYCFDQATENADNPEFAHDEVDD